MRPLCAGLLGSLVALGLASGLVAQPACPPPADATTFANDPFVPTDCWTTEYGPAAADIVTGTNNFLTCETGDYALCFFSGPPYPTGNSPEDNLSLPCTLSDTGGEAECLCQVFSGASDAPYYVDINAILNLGVYNQVVQTCGEEGDGCYNLANGCTSGSEAAGCDGLKVAPVCQYIAGQDPTDQAASLYPDADVISAFSFALGGFDPRGPYTVGSTDCSTTPPGLYAGCMTAPCENLETSGSGPRLATCSCPTWVGPYQVGQSQDHLADAAAAAGQPGADVCHPGQQEGAFYVWSAANTVSGSGSETAAGGGD